MPVNTLSPCAQRPPAPPYLGVDPRFRIFYVDASGDLSLQNVIVTKGCLDDGGGGGIFNSASVPTVINCSCASVPSTRPSLLMSPAMKSSTV